MQSPSFECLEFDRLSAAQCYQILALRERVFLVEQEIVEPDLDGEDLGALHLFAGKPIHSYCRILPPSEGKPVSIGRVVVDRPMRSRGLGKDLMNAAIDQARSTWPDHQIKVSAQAYLERFYSELGFEQRGEGYMEAGIPHIPMLYVR